MDNRPKFISFCGGNHHHQVIDYVIDYGGFDKLNYYRYLYDDRLYKVDSVIDDYSQEGDFVEAAFISFVKRAVFLRQEVSRHLLHTKNSVITTSSFIDDIVILGNKSNIPPRKLFDWCRDINILNFMPNFFVHLYESPSMDSMYHVRYLRAYEAVFNILKMEKKSVKILRYDASSYDDYVELAHIISEDIGVCRENH